MITPGDFLRLPCTPDLTEGGIASMLRSLPYLFNGKDSPQYERLCRIVAGVSVELAFRRHLSREEIPFEVKGAAPFTDPGHFDVLLGGRRCEFHSYLISCRDQISEIQRCPEVLLTAPALVPSDVHAREDHTDRDLYLFALLLGRIADSRDNLEKGDTHYFIHAMDEEWRRPRKWFPLGRLVLKSESDLAFTLEINGQGGDRDFMTRTVELPPRTRVILEDPFHSITSLHASRLPDARLGIHCERSREVYIITPRGWGNIWVDAREIILAGYIPRDEFRRQSAFVPPGSRVFQYSRTHLKNLAVPVSTLRPLEELLAKAREWKPA